MAPALAPRASASQHPEWDGSWKYRLSVDGFILEAWSQGFMVGALVIMAGLTIANMKSTLLLHKLILIELIFAIFHGTFCFVDFDGYGWYVSSTAVLLYSSWYLHNIIAWLKTKPFLGSWYSKIYIFTFLLTTPYWILETYGNFAFNNNINRIFLRTRPFEALCRDPWWIFTIINLLYNIKQRYNFSYIGLIKTSPRFGIMLISMFFSIVFLIVDILAATVKFGAVVGINPYWKLSLVFKCFCDTIILDDFRSALEKIRTAYFNQVDHAGARHENLADKRSKRSTAHLSTPGLAKAIIPKVYAPRISHETDRAGKAKGGGVLSGLFGGNHSRIESEDNSRILVSTDIVMDRHRPGQSRESSKDDEQW